MEKSNNKTFIYVGLGLIIFLILLVIVIYIISIAKGKYLTYEQVIDKMNTATQKYYNDNPNSKPIDEGDYNLSYNTLVDKNYIKPLNELLKDGDSCSAYVIVTNRNANYSYTPYLNCGSNYETVSLYKMLTDPSNVVTSGSGLYKENNTYYYRGEVTNNYIKLGTVKRDDKDVDNIWRIMSISDGIIKIINTKSTNSSYVWDDRYNVTKGGNYGYNDFELSRLKDTLVFLGNRDSVMSSSYRNKIVPTKLCIGKRNNDDTTRDGSTECSTMSNELFNVGTITPYEYMRASLDENCKRTISNSCANYNYLSGHQNSEWLITASTDSNFEAYSYNGAVINASTAYTEKYLFLTANLTDKTFYVKGSGTLNDPYEIR